MILNSLKRNGRPLIRVAARAVKFESGSDVVKAVALGVAEQAGLVRVLELLENEMTTTMGLLGVSRIDQLKPACVCKTQPLAPAHEMSAFPHIPGGRIA